MPLAVAARMWAFMDALIMTAPELLPARPIVWLHGRHHCCRVAGSERIKGTAMHGVASI